MNNCNRIMYNQAISLVRRAHQQKQVVVGGSR